MFTSFTKAQSISILQCIWNSQNKRDIELKEILIKKWNIKDEDLRRVNNDTNNICSD